MKQRRFDEKIKRLMNENMKIELPNESIDYLVRILISRFQTQVEILRIRMFAC